MIKLSCHCGNVNLMIEQLPTSVRDCNCPICNRLGALWADFKFNQVQVMTTNVPTTTYSWDDGQYLMHHCPTCGCTTHYTAIEVSAESAIGINLRMLDRQQLEQIPITANSD